MKDTPQDKEITRGRNRLLSILSSVKLTVVLLLIIAVSSVLGTVIPQKEASEVLSDTLDPWVASLLNVMQLFDVYHSAWFMILVATLCINIVVCSLFRLRNYRRFSKRWNTPARPDRMVKKQFITGNESQNDLNGKIRNILSTAYRRGNHIDTGQGTLVYGERGFRKRLFTHLIHLGVLIIIIGAAIGYLYGFEGYVEIFEGESIEKVYHRVDGSTIDLGFTLRCDDFSMDYYKDGVLKEYRSDLSFLKNEVVVFHTPLLVNHPATFEGIRFYQSNYGVSHEAVLSVTDGTAIKKFTIRSGSIIKLDKDGSIAHVLDLRDNFMRMGPAAVLRISSPRGFFKLFVFEDINSIRRRIPTLFSHYPQFNPASIKPYTFALESVGAKHFTGLMVNRDPGAPIVAAGGICIFTGILMSIISSRKRSGIEIQGYENGMSVAIAVDADRTGVQIDGTVEGWLDSKRGKTP